MKYRLLLEQLNTLHDNDIIIITDGMDVIVADKKEIAINKFLNFNTSILISKDNISNYVANKIYGTYNNININAGLIMGYAGALKILIRLMCGSNFNKCKKTNIDDQALLIYTINNNKEFAKNIKIDINNNIFFNINSLLDTECKLNDTFDIKNNKLYIKNTNISPCFIHGPGNTNLNEICNFYKLPIAKNISRNGLYRINTYTKPYYLIKFIDEFKILLVLLVLYLIFIYYINKTSIVYRKN